MNILVIEPGKRPYEKDIPDTLEAMQETVGGYIQVIKPFDDNVLLVCDEEGLLKPEQKQNRHVDSRTVIRGAFFLCCEDGEDFTDLTPELMKKYRHYFNGIEYFDKEV